MVVYGEIQKTVYTETPGAKARTSAGVRKPGRGRSGGARVLPPLQAAAFMPPDREAVRVMDPLPRGHRLTAEGFGTEGGFAHGADRNRSLLG